MNDSDVMEEKPLETETPNEASVEEALEEGGGDVQAEVTPPTPEEVAEGGAQDLEEGTVSSELSGEDTAMQEKAPGKDSRKVLRRVLWLAIGLAIAFFVGGGLVYNYMVVPTSAAREQAEKEAQAAQQQVADLQSEVDDLKAQLEALNADMGELQEENDALYAARMESETHVILLRVMADVYAARQSLQAGDSKTALLFLNGVDEKLEQLGEYLGDSESQNISNLQKRLSLILSGMEKDKTTALKDMDIILFSLSQLENTYFALP